MGTRISGIVLALALVAAACGDDSDDAGTTSSSPAAAPSPAEATYLEQLATIQAEVDATAELAFEEALINTEISPTEVVLTRVARALETMIAAEERARESVEALETPSRYEADHERLLVFLDERRALLRTEADAAAAVDQTAIREITIERESAERAFVADVAPEFAEAVGSSAGEVSSLTSLDDADLTYLDEVQGALQEFAVRAEQFGQALQQTYTSDELLLLALLDAGAGEAFAAVRDVAVEIEPPASYSDAHQDLMAYFDEAVRLDEIIADAAERGDVVAFEVANVGLDLAAGRFSLGAPPELANLISGEDFPLLVDSDAEAGEYDLAVADVLRTFRILGLEAPVSSGVFPSLSNETVVAALAEMEPRFIELTDDAVAGLDALDPPADLATGHARLTSYLGDLLAVRERALEAATSGDDDTLRDLGFLDDLRLRDRAEVGLWCSARADLVDDPIWSIVEPFFEPFGGPVSVTELCPA